MISVPLTLSAAASTAALSSSRPILPLSQTCFQHLERPSALQMRPLVLGLYFVTLSSPSVFGASPPGRGPFTQAILPQPVSGAQRGESPDGWLQGKLCDVSKSPYLARNGTNATMALERALSDCGDRPDGGTVLIPSGYTLWTASLWLRSNLTLRVETGATLQSTATGSGSTPEVTS